MSSLLCSSKQLSGQDMIFGKCIVSSILIQGSFDFYGKYKCFVYGNKSIFSKVINKLYVPCLFTLNTYIQIKRKI